LSSILEVVSHSEEETLGLARKLVPAFRPGDVIVLEGSLGTGKTVFVRGLALALDLDVDKVNSPSYTLVNEYPGRRPLYHFDLYRMQDTSELIEIGWDDYLQREGLIAVEWGMRAAECLPESYYLVELEIISESERRITIKAVEP